MKPQNQKTAMKKTSRELLPELCSLRKEGGLGEFYSTGRSLNWDEKDQERFDRQCVFYGGRTVEQESKRLWIVGSLKAEQYFPRTRGCLVWFRLGVRCT